MKIAMIGQKGIPASYGGVERHVHDLAVRLVESGQAVTVYSRRWYTKTSADSVAGVRAVYLPSIATKHLDTISHTLLASLHALGGRFDVIHYHGVGPALWSWLPRLFSPRTKVVTTFHSIDRYHQKWNRFARLVLRLGEWAACLFAHATITISPTLQSYCRNEFGRETNYIPSGVPTVHGAAPAAREHLDQFGLFPGEYILTVGRLIPCKAVHVLIEAFRRLKQTNSDHPAVARLKLVIVGGSVFTDEYVRELHRQASPCNDIVFTDFQSGPILGTLYRHALLLAQPSLIEGLPITVLEGMSYRKAVLASNIAEHYQLVQDGSLLFEPNNSSALADALLHYIDLPDDAKAQIAERNYRLVQEQYSWETVLAQIIDVYGTPAAAAKAERCEALT